MVFPFPLVYSWVLDFGAELNLADAYNACFVRENRAGLTLMSRKSNEGKIASTAKGTLLIGSVLLLI